jgi:hypothetical protein
MKRIILIMALSAGMFSAKAQEIEQFLVLGEDAGTLMQSYLQPAFEGTIYNLNSGWYRTAKPHRLLGFDITLNATLSSVPNNRKNFTFDIADYSNVRLESGANQAELPTAFGGSSDEVLIVSKDVDTPFGPQTAEFKMDALEGIGGEIGFDQVPAAMVQAGIGLPFKTDVTLRFVPKVGSDSFKTNLFGIGVKHNILQYFPIAKRVPLVDVSLFGGYTKLSSQYIPGQDQTIDMEVTSLTGQLLGSVDLKIVNFFVGLGYSTGKSSLVVAGDYEFQYRDPTTGLPLGAPQKIKEEDLPNIKNDVNSFMTTAGMSINLAFFKIYGSYTLQEYNSINAGVAFSFR